MIRVYTTKNKYNEKPLVSNGKLKSRALCKVRFAPHYFDVNPCKPCCVPVAKARKSEASYTNTRKCGV